MGGTSDERDVSLSSGAQVAAALREAGHAVVAVDTVRGVLPPQEERHLLLHGVQAAPPEEADLEAQSLNLRGLARFANQLSSLATQDKILQGILEETRGFVDRADIPPPARISRHLHWDPNSLR